MFEVVLNLFCLVVGAVISLYIAKMFHKEKRPTYLIHWNKFISAENTNLEIKYKGHAEPIKEVAVTNFHFWNAGRESINKDDLAKGNPLRIVSGDQVTILEATATNCTNPDCKLDIQKNREKNVATISFEFVGPGDGCIFQIVHTGSKMDDIELKGGFKGIKLDCRILKRRNAALTWVLVAQQLISIAFLGSLAALFVSVLDYQLFSKYNGWLAETSDVADSTFTKLESESQDLFYKAFVDKDAITDFATSLSSLDGNLSLNDQQKEFMRMKAKSIQDDRTNKLHNEVHSLFSPSRSELLDVRLKLLKCRYEIGMKDFLKNAAIFGLAYLLMWSLTFFSQLGLPWIYKKYSSPFLDRVL